MYALCFQSCMILEFGQGPSNRHDTLWVSRAELCTSRTVFRVFGEKFGMSVSELEMMIGMCIFIDHKD